MKTKRIVRILKMLIMLLSGGRVKIDTLSESLGVSRRTIFRDMQALSEAGLPCYYDRRSNSHVLPADYLLQVPKFSREEALGLLFMAYKGTQCLDFPLKRHATSAMVKIEAGLPEDVKRYCHHILENISVKASKQANVTKYDDIFTQILNAILRKQILSIKLFNHVYTDIDFCPLHLLYSDFNWYVIGKLGKSNENKIIDIRNIRRLRRTKRLFVSNEFFDLTEYLGRAWSTVPEGNLYSVKLRFDPEIANDVISRQWHSTQYATVEEDGSALVEFRIDGLNEITWWVASFADKVEVLAPQILRERIHKAAANMASRNKIVEIRKKALPDKRPQNIVSL